MKQLLEFYENGDIALMVYDVEGEKRWWLRAGAALLEFDGERLEQLLDLLFAYAEEGL